MVFLRTTNITTACDMCTLPSSVYGTEPEECVRQCQSLLDEPNLDTAIRTGDVYGLLVEHYAQSGNYKQVGGARFHSVNMSIISLSLSLSLSLYKRLRQLD